MSTVWDILVVVSLFVVFTELLRAIIVRCAGLRLTDWLGYVVCVAGLVAMTSRLWDTAPWLLWCLPVAAVFAVMHARRSVSVWRRGEKVHGLFFVGRPPAGVVDRLKWGST